MARARAITQKNQSPIANLKKTNRLFCREALQGDAKNYKIKSKNNKTPKVKRPNDKTMGTFRMKFKIGFARLKGLRGSARILQLGVVSFAGLQIAKQQLWRAAEKQRLQALN